MSDARVSPLAAFLGVLLLASVGSAATCPPSCPVPGGKNPALDCAAEFAGQGIRLNYPHLDPGHRMPAREERCFAGDAACDTDDAVDHVCTFDVDVCLRTPDPALPACTPADVTAVSVAGTTHDPDLAAL